MASEKEAEEEFAMVEGHGENWLARGGGGGGGGGVGAPFPRPPFFGSRDRALQKVIDGGK